MGNDKYDYNKEHTRNNTPHYLYRILILFLSPVFSGFNVLILSLSDEYRALMVYGIVLFIVFAVIGVINIFDNRMGMKSLAAVIVWILIYLGSSVLMLCYMPFAKAAVVLGTEILLFSAVLTVTTVKNRSNKNKRT